MNHLLTSLLIGLCCYAHAQIIDDFSVFPRIHWYGDTALFQASNGQLLSNGSGTDSLLLSCKNELNNDSLIQLEISFQLDLSPSNNNFLELHLCSDSLLSPSSSSLYLRIGETGAADQLRLFQRIQGTDSLIYSTAYPDNFIKNRNFQLLFLYSDDSLLCVIDTSANGIGDTVFQSSLMPSFRDANFFHILCRHTSSNVQNFRFDEFKWIHYQKDNDGPKLLGLSTNYHGHIEALFNEAPYQLNQLDVLVNNGTIDSLHQRTEVLTVYASQVENKSWNKVQFTVQDVFGNLTVLTDSVFHFAHEFSDLRFTELMIDPSPPVGLPEAEYIEIQNFSSVAINLEGWSLRDEQKTYPLSNYLLPANSVLLLVDEDELDSFSCKHKLGLNTPSLSNSGKCIQLINPKNQIIDEICYFSDSYKDSRKEAGGWSLSLIDSSLQAYSHCNWQASKQATGGSPGQENEWENSSCSPHDLQLKYLLYHQPDSVELQLDQSLEKFQLPQLLQLKSNLEIESMEVGFGNRLQIKFKGEIRANSYLHLSNLKGNESESPSQIKIELSPPISATNAEIYITELLAQPQDEQEEYIELLNLSAGPIRLNELRIGKYDSLFAQIQDPKPISDLPLYWPPNSRLLLSSYEMPSECTAICLEAKIPSMGNSSGSIAVSDASLNLIDSLLYEDDWHHPYLSNLDGVALEKIHSTGPNEKSNWRSASSTDNYGSPGCENSQHSNSINISGKCFYLSNYHISTNNDGLNDDIEISFKFPVEGYGLRTLIFNESGSFIGEAFPLQTLSTSGSLFWNGSTATGSLLEPGVYYLLLEAAHPSRKPIKEKQLIIIEP